MLDKVLKKFIQQNKNLIIQGNWEKIFSNAIDSFIFNEYGRAIKDLLNIFQSANLLKNGIKDIFPNFTHYADYDKLHDVLKDLTIDFSNWNGKKAKDVLDIISKNSSNIEILDVMYFGPKQFDIAKSIIVPGVDLTNILIIFGDLDKKSSIYTVISDDNFLKNMKCIPEIGIAYNKDEVLNIFKKYINLLS